MLQHVPRPTEAYHTESYPAISPSRPELSLKGKTVLITGGASGIGWETTKAFAQAGASKIVLLARSQGPMDKAQKEIESTFPGTKVLTFAASVADTARVAAIVKEVGVIDILALNAAIMHAPGPVLDIDADELTQNLVVNAIGPLGLVKAFLSLPPRAEGAERTIIYTSSAGSYIQIPGVSGYNASKAAMNYLMASVAQDYGSKGVRVFTFHPAVAFTPMARDVMGMEHDSVAYDSPKLPAHFAVWLCSPEADFLKGRYVWAHWDVDQLKAKKDIILNDPSQLTIGLVQDKLLA